MTVETKKLNAIQAINQAIAQAMAADPTVLVLGEDVADREGGGVVGVTKGLSTQFGDDRVRSTPISEQAIIGAAIGAAIDGYKPVAEIMLMNFTTVAMDMIFNHAAKLRYMSGGQTTVPIVIRMMTGAGIASGGQHSDFLEAWFAHTPGLKVVAPSNPADAKGLMLSCIADPDPCIFIETSRAYGVAGDVPVDAIPVPLGKAAIAREGSDVTLISYAEMVTRCLACGGGAGEGRRVGRGRRSAHDLAVGSGNRAGFGPQDRPRRGGPRSGPHFRGRRGNCRDDPCGAVRRAQGPGPPPWRAVHAGAVRRQPRAGVPRPACRNHRRCAQHARHELTLEAAHDQSE